MQCDGRQCAYMTTDTPTITPTVGLAGRGKLRLPPTPRRGSEAQAATSSHCAAPDAPSSTAFNG
jgi:hypothetical protein